MSKLLPIVLVFFVLFSCDIDSLLEPENNSSNGIPELVIVSTTASTNYSSGLIKLQIQIRNDGDVANIGYAQYVVPGAIIVVNSVYGAWGETDSYNISLFGQFSNVYLPVINPGEYFIAETDWLDISELISASYTWTSISHYNSAISSP